MCIRDSSKEGKKLAYTVDSMNMPVVFGAAAAFGMQKKAMTVSYTHLTLPTSDLV